MFLPKQSSESRLGQAQGSPRTPTKVCFDERNSICRLCGKNFKLYGVGKEGSQNLQNLPKTKGKQEVTFRNKLEDVLGYQIPSESLKLSSVICKACVRKVERLHKALLEIRDLKAKFGKIEDLVKLGNGKARQKRLSKSPHQNSATKIRVQSASAAHSASASSLPRSIKPTETRTNVATCAKNENHHFAWPYYQKKFSDPRRKTIIAQSTSEPFSESISKPIG